MGRKKNPDDIFTSIPTSEKKKKQRLLTSDPVRNIVPNWRPALMN